MKRKNYDGIICNVIMALCGACIGVFFMASIESYYKINRNIFDIVIYVTFLIIFMVISLITHLIFHEGGHLIFGLMSGYKFVSFRIFNFTIVKVKNKIMIKKFNVPGTLGQCLLKPCDYNNGDFPYKLYNLGGVICNILLSFIGIILICTLNMDIYLYTYIVSFSIIGIIIAIQNGIPMNANGIGNDGYNLLNISKNQNSKKGFWVSLEVNALESEGTRIKDMPIEWFKTEENEKSDSIMSISLKILLANYYYDKLEFNKEEEILKDVLNNSHNLLKLYENEIKCELAFVEIIGMCRKDKVNELWNENLEKYIKSCEYNITKKRLLYAKSLIMDKDNEKAENIFKDILESAKLHPVQAEAEREIEVVNYVRDKYKK